MAVKPKKQVLVPLNKGNEQIKVLEEHVPHYLTQGWKKLKVVKGKRDDKTGRLLEGEEDKVVYEGIDEPDIAALKAKIVKLEAEIVTLKGQAK